MDSDEVATSPHVHVGSVEEGEVAYLSNDSGKVTVLAAGVERCLWGDHARASSPPPERVPPARFFDAQPRQGPQNICA